MKNTAPALIPFNKPFIIGKELQYIREAVRRRHLSGDGFFSRQCQSFFEQRYHFRKTLLTHSCTAALEMAALLLDIQAGDEIIMPSFTFVSTANAFVLRGAVIRFADCLPHYPNIDPQSAEALINERTKAIVVVHYGGVACDMETLQALAQKYRLYLIEDAAHAIESFYKGKPLGGFGHLAAFSFHETKNIIAGEGGLLVINDEQLAARAEIIREKGTNRAAFFRGETDKYTWVDIGSSYLPSELIAAFLWGQLEHLESIQARRIALWNNYATALEDLRRKGVQFAEAATPPATLNGHLFYMLCNDVQERQSLIQYLKTQQIHAVFHYQSLHSSPYYLQQKSSNTPTYLPYSDMFSERLLRLPLFYGLKAKEQKRVIAAIKTFYE